MKYLRRMYDWLINAASGPYALPILLAVSFMESSFFPIPPDIMLIPMVLATPKKRGILPVWQRLQAWSAAISAMRSVFTDMI